MKANETTLRNLLQGERQYVVPLYQRPYSWERRDLQQLWSDLLSVAGGHNDASHFLGSVVLAPSPSNTPASVQSWLVVDGQQRLTTLSILLCAIRDHVASENERLSARIDDLYLFNQYASGLERYTLLPTQADRDSWLALLERAPNAGGEDKIGLAYRFFRKELIAFGDNEEGHDFAHIEQSIAGRLSIVEIAAHPDDNVHRIFESLNHTGQPLTQADLLRNYLFMRLPNKAKVVYDQQWLPLQKLLDNKQLEELVWLDLVLRGDDRATQDGVYQAQQNNLNKLTTEEDIQAWISELHRKARLFRKVLNPEAEPNNTLRRALQRLKDWGAHVVHPIALRVLIAHEDEELSAHEAARALRVVESFLVRRILVGIGNTNANRILMSLVKELGESVPSASEVTKILSGPRKRFPTDQHLKDAVLANNFYWTGRGPQRSYILRCLEEDYRHGEPIDFSRSKLTIEHVLPQSLTREWRDMLAKGLPPDETPEELHRSLVHTLGNLTLTAYNNKLGNDDFDTKKQILADSGLSMNREIANAESWGSTEIRNRGRALADRAIRIWPGPDDSATTEPPPNARWSLMTQVLASIPAGRWTSYADIAEVIGSHQVSVNGRLASSPVANAHRVLKLNGRVSSEFRWPDPSCTDDPRRRLETEGVKFDDNGKASAAQRISATELARLIDLDTDVPEVTSEDSNPMISITDSEVLAVSGDRLVELLPRPDVSGILSLPDDHPLWDLHSGGDGHRMPDWNPSEDIELAQSFYQAVEGKAKVLLDILIDHPGRLFTAQEICSTAGDTVFTNSHSVAGSLQGLAKPREESRLRFPFCWWQGPPTRYAMRSDIAALFRRARSSSA
ncbi:GmrSD restriction endonuclease domain-containing protein [Saccharomonospora azurea]|uniref:GmrSD restriction endonuclease domain-containing protein n=1 Tax=Saccharomonospora azurea TaxID=40988 RepID=UPI003D930B17